MLIIMTSLGPSKVRALGSRRVELGNWRVELPSLVGLGLRGFLGFRV